MNLKSDQNQFSINERDTLFATSHPQNKAFEFDENVARVFPDMIRRSAPGYETSQELIEAVAAMIVQSGDIIYDVGCSLGASTFRLAKSSHVQKCEIFAIDSSKAMIEGCQKILRNTLQFNLQAFKSSIFFQEKKAEELVFSPCRLILLNYVLQFISPNCRDKLVQRMHKALVPGGVLLISEKIIPSAHELVITENIHQQFKKCRGYSDLEIAQKRNALEGVLIAETLVNHRQRLESVGFEHVQILAQSLHFCTFMAVKSI